METHRNINAVRYMLFAVIGFSFLPLIIALVGGEDKPFLVSAVVRMATGTGSMMFLCVVYRRMFFNWATWHLIIRRLFRLPFLLAFISFFDIAAIAFSVKFIDVSVAAVLFETGPILQIVLLSRVIEGRYRKLTRRTFLLLALAFAGVVCVIIGQRGGIGNATEVSALSMVLGVVLVLCGAGISSFVVFVHRWGIYVSKELQTRTGPAGPTEPANSIDLFCVVAGMGIGNFLSALASIPLALLNKESLLWDSLVMAGHPLGVELVYLVISVGVVMMVAASIVVRKALLETSNLGIIGLAYAIPVISLLWLILFSQTGEVALIYIAVGVAVIVAGNALINLSQGRFAE